MWEVVTPEAKASWQELTAKAGFLTLQGVVPALRPLEQPPDGMLVGSAAMRPLEQPPDGMLVGSAAMTVYGQAGLVSASPS